MRRVLFFLLAVGAVVGCAGRGYRSESKYAPGQVWSYETRSHEKDSKLYIVLVTEDVGFGRIYHICLDELSLKNPKAEGGRQDTLYAPVTSECLDSSVTDLIETRKLNLPDVSDGYQAWLGRRKDKTAGVFVTFVKGILHYTEGVMAMDEGK